MSEEAIYKLHRYPSGELEEFEYVQKLVRCKECKHNYNTAINHGKMQPRCDFTDRKLSEDDYCSRGERESE